MDKKYIRCGKLFNGISDSIEENQTICIENGVVTKIAPSHTINPTGGIEEVDFSGSFVIPGMIDTHTHLAYGNAKTEEDIDIYAPMEFRALRAMYFAHQVLGAGFTSIAAPGDAGMISSSVRDAIDAGLFEGPNVTAAGPYLTSRQGLTDWYPTWIGLPQTSLGRLVRGHDEIIEEIRRQVKDGVDAVKLALDGVQKRPNGEHIAAFTLPEVQVMVDEIHRLGKFAIAHARGREATLYAAKTGVDLIFHASYMDDEGLEEIIANKCAISPSLTLLRNTMDYALPLDPVVRKGRRDAYEREYSEAVRILSKAHKAGVPMPVGTDSGFAITPYGEWHARELEIYVDDLGFSTIEALKAVTSVSAKSLRPTQKVGQLTPGYRADIVALHADPTKDIKALQEKEKFHGVLLNGKPITQPRTGYDPRKVSDFSLNMFNDLYTRERVAELTAQS